MKDVADMIEILVVHDGWSDLIVLYMLFLIHSVSSQNVTTG